jgi:hypothetical protein
MNMQSNFVNFVSRLSLYICFSSTPCRSSLKSNFVYFVSFYIRACAYALRHEIYEISRKKLKRVYDVMESWRELERWR